MLHRFAFIVCAAALPITTHADTFGSGGNAFTIDFGLSPPPHSPGVPDSGALLDSDLFFVAIYLSSTPPLSGRIVEIDDGGALHAIFEFSGLVYAAYPSGGTAYSYEESWSLSASQIQSLREGEWYAQVSYADSTFLGQITQVPEPSSLALGAGSLAVVVATARRRSHKQS